MKPHCDTSTGEIYGCDKGSFSYYHEEGHIEFNRSPETSWLLMLKSYIFDIWMLSVMFSFVFKSSFYIMVFLWLGYTFLTVYEERWCNAYAKEKLFKDSLTK